MYSVVLMMALSGAPATPAFGGRGCDGGCWGGGCHGARGCHGGNDCCGRRGLFGGRKGCHDCGGGGCHGRRGHGCHGGNGCHGGYGCNGGGYGCYASGGYGCTGGAGCAASGAAVEKVDTKPKEKGKEEARIATPATIVVSLPAEAKLMIDDYVTTSTSATRVFTSPALEPGKVYTYSLTATLMRDGQQVNLTKDVTVKAGQETRVTLDFPVATVASR